VSILGLLIVLMVISVVVYAVMRPRRPAVPVHGQAQTERDMKPVPIGNPKIDLRAVEEALWNTKTDNPKDFKGWMSKFEDEVNAIYFATLRQQNPQADPATLLKEPVRIDPQRINNLLYLYGYQDQNKKPGFQNGEDLLLFVFQQTGAFDSQNRRLNYALRDGNGYYYRDPAYTHTFAPTVAPMMLGFFLYPAIWYGMWWRPSFMWLGTPYWAGGMFHARYNHYYRSYPRYHSTYRSTYHARSRPWGWNRGAYYQKGAGGQYYRRGASGSYRRSTGTSGQKRSTGTSGQRRSTGSSGYRRSTGTSGQRRSTGSSGYRRSSGGGRRR
jgi:hypothetical protein